MSPEDFWKQFDRLEAEYRKVPRVETKQPDTLRVSEEALIFLQQAYVSGMEMPKDWEEYVRKASGDLT